MASVFRRRPRPHRAAGRSRSRFPANGIATPRDLHATIAGLDFVVHQASAGCAVSLSPLEAAASSGGATGSVSVTTTPGCGYDTTSGPGWVTITSGGSGGGSGTLVYEVQPNSTTVQRIGTLTIGGQSFTITQEGVACSVTVDTGALGSPYSKDGGLGGSIGVVANGANCAWVAGSAAGWAHLSKTSGSGTDTINVTLDSNASSTSITFDGSHCSRPGHRNRAERPHLQLQPAVRQRFAAWCGRSRYGRRDCAERLPVERGQQRPGLVEHPVVGISGNGEHPVLGNRQSQYVGFAAGNAQHPGRRPRRGEDLHRDPGSGAVHVLAGSSSDTANGGGENKSFTWSASCTPTAVSYANWLTNVTTGAGTVQYTVQPNPTTFSRKGTIQVGDQTFTVTQSSGTCGYSFNTYGVSFWEAGRPRDAARRAERRSCPSPPVVGTTQPFITLFNLTGGPPVQWSQTYGVAPYNSLTATIRKGAITFGGQVFTVKQTSW